MKVHLEPLAIAAQITQAANTRLDQVLLIFSFLYTHFASLSDKDPIDKLACDSICLSLNKHWLKFDQDVFIACLILNPLH